jgi:asparagine synthase (glutamine-hydrolysing)
MCGISGFTFEDPALAARMNDAVAHRGPDGAGVWSEPGITLAHRRLSIIDLSDAAAQPMISADGNLVITYNGELYNFQALRRELSHYPFRTKCDTEVILAAYREWGAACLDHFNGIFAFAIWDRVSRELFLARDHIGVKPLYYAHDGDQFVFSSELKGVFECPWVSRGLDHEQALSFFRLLYAPGPRTMIEGVRKLPPAHRMTLTAGHLREERYFSLRAGRPRPASSGGFPAAATHLRGVVEEACDRQLVSDRPVGIYLSGGIDSSSILAAVAARRGADIDTYSVGFALSETEQEAKFNADFRLARRTADRFGTSHHEYLLSGDEALSLLEPAVGNMDDPVSNPTILAQTALARFTKPTATVVLSGDGGDELFGGYERYRWALRSEWYRRLVPRAVRAGLAPIPQFAKLGTAPGIDQFQLFLFAKDKSLAPVLSGELADDTTAERLERQLYADMEAVPDAEALMRADRESWLVDEALTRTDRTTMAAGVEGRVPLLDREVIEYALGLPPAFRLTPLALKRVLKAAFRDSLPQELFAQPKRGWFSPAAKWVRQPRMQEAMRAILAPDYYPATAPLFNWAGIDSMISEHVEMEAYHLTALWALMTFQIWARTYSVGL